MSYNLATSCLENRANWWLRTPSGSSATNACYANANGNANYNSVTNTNLRPLP